MITNEERREVAGKLLDTTTKLRGASFWFEWEANLEDALGVPVKLTSKDRDRLMAALDRLEDLIEPGADTMVVGGYQPKESGKLRDAPKENAQAKKSALREIRYGYVSRVSSNSWLPSGDPLTAEIEVEGAIDLRLSIDNDKAADWCGKRVKVTVEVDSE